MTQFKLHVARALVALLAVAANAQGLEDPLGPSNPSVLKQQGRLFTVQIVRGEPIRFYVVGREEAAVDLSKLSVTVRRLEPSPGRVLVLDRQNDYFVSQASSELKEATAIEVTAKTKSKVESIRLQIDQPRP